MSILKSEIIGYVGQDATAGEHDGRKVINFSVAHSFKYKNADGTQIERTTWVYVSYWSEHSHKLAPYIKKGVLLAVSGEPSARAYTKKDGQQAAALEIKARQIDLLSGAKTNENPKEESEPAQDNGGPEDWDPRNADF